MHLLTFICLDHYKKVFTDIVLSITETLKNASRIGTETVTFTLQEYKPVYEGGQNLQFWRPIEESMFLSTKIGLHFTANLILFILKMKLIQNRKYYFLMPFIWKNIVIVFTVVY